MLDILAAAGEAVEGVAHEAEHVVPTAFGIAPHGYVALAMLVVFAIALWARVPRIIAKLLDDRIAGIRTQLDEASKLRAEAAALRDEYAQKAKDADKEIAAIRDQAERHAAEIVEKARLDADALIERHKALSADKIAAAERNAIDELRATAAAAAAAAARELLGQELDEAADRKLVDRAIAEI